MFSNIERMATNPNIIQNEMYFSKLNMIILIVKMSRHLGTKGFVFFIKTKSCQLYFK